MPVLVVSFRSLKRNFRPIIERDFARVAMLSISNNHFNNQPVLFSCALPKQKPCVCVGGGAVASKGRLRFHATHKRDFACSSSTRLRDCRCCCSSSLCRCAAVQCFSSGTCTTTSLTPGVCRCGIFRCHGRCETKRAFVSQLLRYSGVIVSSWCLSCLGLRLLVPLIC